MKEIIKQALEKATPGPWKGFYNGEVDFFGEPDNAYMFPADDISPDELHVMENAPTWLRWQNERIEELEKALTIVRDTLAHRKDDSRTDWYLWNEADKVLKGVSHDT